MPETSDEEGVAWSEWGFICAAFLLLLLGSGSAVVQGLVFPTAETSFGPILVIWLATAGFYFAGTVLVMLARSFAIIAAYFVLAALTSLLLLGTTLLYALGSTGGVSELEYLALGAYLLGLVLMILIVGFEFGRRQ